LYPASQSPLWAIGAERLAFRCQLSDKMQVDGFAFATLVAKETNLVERTEENTKFLIKFYSESCCQFGI
jgi:hypothetical protein